MRLRHDEIIALTFESQAEVYSYLKQGTTNEIIPAKEKVVISENASAGTYIFKAENYS